MSITINISELRIFTNNQNLNLQEMANSIDDLLAEVAEAKTITASVKTFIGALRQKIADAIADADTNLSDAELVAIKAKVDEAVQELAANNDALAGAIVENTPNSGDTTTGTTTGTDTTTGTTTGTTTDTTGTPDTGATPPGETSTSTDTVPAESEPGAIPGSTII